MPRVAFALVVFAVPVGVAGAAPPEQPARNAALHYWQAFAVLPAPKGSGDKLTEELKGRIEAARRERREAMAKKDAAAAKEKTGALGKLLKEAGAVVYARRWPDPNPAVFGYHEVFHAMVLLGAAMHFAVVARMHWA